MKYRLASALILLSLTAVAHGQNRPATSPPTTKAMPRATATDAVDRLLEVWDLAQGGPALNSIKTRVVRGRIEMSGSALPGSFEQYQKEAGKYIKSMMVANTPRGQILSVRDGNRYWVQTPWGATVSAGYGDEVMVRPVPGHSGPKWKQLFSAASLKGIGRIDGREMIVLAATLHGRPPMVWHFDATTGLLRKLEFANPVAGNGGERMLGVYFDSYMTVDGVKVPALYRQVYQKFTLTFQVTEVKHNLPIDDAMFANPNGN